ncbi:MAG: hypothetical protein A4E58_01244 [Syntrophorhabdus sp. PtaB.Bin006]|nr:MAG: hypothetical protein A4E58_01244 [Syntrophorhabdus sp. PtaB.Bin006]
MRVIGNLLWFILGGAWMGLARWIAGLLAYVSVVGIPWGKGPERCFALILPSLRVKIIIPSRIRIPGNNNVSSVAIV